MTSTMIQSVQTNLFNDSKDLGASCRRTLYARMRAEKFVAVSDFEEYTTVDSRGTLLQSVSIHVEKYRG